MVSFISLAFFLALAGQSRQFLLAELPILTCMNLVWSQQLEERERVVQMADLPQNFDWIQWKRLTYSWSGGNSVQGQLVLETEVQGDQIVLHDRWQIHCVGHDGILEVKSVHTPAPSLDLKEFFFRVSADGREPGQEWCDFKIGEGHATVRDNTLFFRIGSEEFERLLQQAPETLGLFYRRMMGLNCRPDRPVKVQAVSSARSCAAKTSGESR